MGFDARTETAAGQMRLRFVFPSAKQPGRRHDQEGLAALMSSLRHTRLQPGKEGQGLQCFSKALVVGIQHPRITGAPRFDLPPQCRSLMLEER